MLHILLVEDNAGDVLLVREAIPERSVFVQFDEELLDGLHQTHEVDLDRRALVKR